MARPFAAPPGIPADRAKALRDAFDATVKDPEFLAEAERLKFEVRPMTGAQVEALVKEIYATPTEIVNHAIEVMQPSK
jgi:tripartite-type tricarboxylate transporter receptor subunit TctC